ncbi:FAD binding domain-containing protein [Mycolicibacterium sp. CBM1]
MITEIVRSTRFSELLDQLASPDTVVVAGGTDFVPLYAAGVITATRALDLTAVPDLRRVDDVAAGLSIGAGVRLADAAVIEPAYAGAIADGSSLVGSTQTRARATIGGNVCRASPSGDTLGGLLCCGASFVLASKTGARSVPSSEFFLGPGYTECRPDEVLTTIAVPARPAVSAYVRSTVRNAMDLATVGVAVSVDLDGDVISGARLSVVGAGPRPILVEGIAEILTGRPLEDCGGRVDALDELIQQQISPIDDARGSAWYRRKLITPLVRGALARATGRAVREAARETL